MKLKEMLKERERLRKIDERLQGYDELKKWKRLFEMSNTSLRYPLSEPTDEDTDEDNYEYNDEYNDEYIPHIYSDSKIPYNIRGIIINALQAEIDKMERELK